MIPFRKRGVTLATCVVLINLVFVCIVGFMFGWRHKQVGRRVSQECVVSVVQAWTPELNLALMANHPDQVSEILHKMAIYPCVDRLLLISQGEHFAVPQSYQDGAGGLYSVYMLREDHEGQELLLGELRVAIAPSLTGALFWQEYLLYLLIAIVEGVGLFAVVWFLNKRLYTDVLSGMRERVLGCFRLRGGKSGEQGSGGDSESCLIEDDLAVMQDGKGNVIVGDALDELSRAIEYGMNAIQSLSDERSYQLQALEEEMASWQRMYVDCQSELKEVCAQSTQCEKALQQVSDSLQRINDVKSDFLSNMSHEIRTPMHAILSFADLGYERLEGAEDRRSREYFKYIAEGGRRLMRILNNLLDLSKMESGRMTYVISEQKIQDVIRSLQEELSDLMRETDTALEIVLTESDGQAHFDTNRIAQVLRNVLLNAMSFGGAGKVLRIEMCDVEYISELGGVKGKVPGLQIDVIDQGIGIPAGEHETIFNKFALSTKTATGAGGSGLGLSVCKEIMRAHHGVILALDAPGGGAIFRCILPKVAIRRLGMAD